MMPTKKPPYVLEQGDCVAYSLARPAGFADLVVADPPYNFGMKYDSYHDEKSYEEYLSWAHEWLHAIDHALTKHGSAWIFVPDEWVSEIDLAARQSFHWYKRGHIVWTFTFGRAAQKNFSRSHCHILYFTKTKTKFTFNDKVVRVPSARQLVYNDKRALHGGKMPDDTWCLLREQLEKVMTGDKDVWLESRICGTFKERKKHTPNQIPEPVMARIILSCTNPGDLVFDPFMGSGSAGVVAVQNKRRYVGVDVSKDCVKNSTSRIQKATHS